MERNYENVYLVTSPDEQVQKLLETMSDILVGTLYIAEKGDRIVADFVSEIPDCCWHLESESILMAVRQRSFIKCTASQVWNSQRRLPGYCAPQSCPIR